MKTVGDKSGIITFQPNFLDRIWLRILLKYSGFKYWLSRKDLYKKVYYKYIRKFSRIKFMLPFEQNSWDEAAININKEIRHEAVKKRLIEMKEEMGEEELLKVMKKKLNRKEYKKLMEDINRWKKRGIWR
jgi:hypothetical protein